MPLLNHVQRPRHTRAAVFTAAVLAGFGAVTVGLIRLRGHGSSGGHLGLESLRQALGSTAYARLRIGVGAAASSAELPEHVLEEFGEEEERVVEQAIERAAEAVECWLAEGLPVAMNRFNRRVRKEESTP